jgi:hypothetical protein
VNSIFFVTMLTLLLTFGRSPAFFQEQPLLWFAGPMHSNEVKAETGDTWLALCHTSKGYELVSTKITVRDNPKKDGLFDTEVTLDCSCPSLFLVYGVPELKPGPINTIFDGSKYIEPSQSIILQLAKDQESTYTLSASGSKNGEEVKNYQLKLRSNKRTQLILNRASIYEHIYLLWAGDLDGDGKLDLLLDLHDHYNVSEPTLFLSSKAEKGKLVKRFTSYRTNSE